MDLAKAEVQANKHGEEIEKSKMRHRLRTLRAPVAGTNQQLTVHTLGGVVTPAEHLMVIVPQDASLEIEAELQNKDIGFVHKGQPVEIKVETFNFSRYGLLRGTVANVSRDAVSPSENGGRPLDPLSSEATTTRDAQDRQPAYIAHITFAARGVE